MVVTSETDGGEKQQVTSRVSCRLGFTMTLRRPWLAGLARARVLGQQSHIREIRKLGAKHDRDKELFFTLLLALVVVPRSVDSNFFFKKTRKRHYIYVYRVLKNESQNLGRGGAISCASCSRSAFPSYLRSENSSLTVWASSYPILYLKLLSQPR
jgi:hypothetical protein